MKKIFAIGAASLCCAAPAVAGPYVNVEAKSSLVLTIARLFFTMILAGHLKLVTLSSTRRLDLPVIPDGGDQTTELAGKTGIKLKVNKNLGVYGEISAMTKDQIDFDSLPKVGTKVGFLSDGLSTI